MDPLAFCRVRFSPLLATGVILTLLREHFGNKNAISDPIVQRCVWGSSDISDILIESSSNESLINVGQRPAILVRRNNITSERRIINDEVLTIGGQRGRDFWIQLNGSHTVFSIATKPAYAESLSNEATILLTQYAPQIKYGLCFKDFQLREIGQLSLLEGSGGQYVVPSTFSYIATFEWTLEDDLPPLRHIDVRVLHGLD